MKIVHILLGKANPDTLNGVNKIVHYLATTQLEHGHDVAVWGITSSSLVARHEHAYPLRLFKRTRTRFWLDVDLLKVIAALPTGTAIHLHSVFVSEFFSIVQKLQTRKLNWVVTPHGGV